MTFVLASQFHVYSILRDCEIFANLRLKLYSPLQAAALLGVSVRSGRASWTQI